MADNRLQIHKSPFITTACASYTCRQSYGKDKYKISNPYGHGHDGETYCEDCIKHLVATIPPELLEGGTDLAARIREELETEYAKRHQDDMEAIERRLRNEITAEVAVQFATQLQDVAPEKLPDVQPEAEKEEEEQKEPIVYRCLDCNAEFDTPQKLGSHKAKAHKEEPPKARRR